MKFFGANNLLIHFLAGIGAAALAFVVKGKGWRSLLAGVSSAELAFAGARFFRKRSADEDTEMPVSESVRTAEVDGINMRWEEHGAADNIPVIFVHGIPTSPRLWRFVMPRLALSGARCYAWEMPGFGASWREGLGRDISVSKQVEYLHKWLRHLNIHQAVFVGHDLGGGVAQLFAVEHTGYCMGLVLIDCATLDNWPVPMMKAARSNVALIRKTPAFLLRSFIVPQLLAQGHDNIVRGRQSLKLHWRNYAHGKGGEALAHQIASLDATDTMDVSDRLKEIKAPAKVVWGEKDLLSVESGKKLAEKIGADFLLIEGAKHFTPEDHPDEISEAIKNLMTKVEIKAPLNQ